jgi:crotonobetainyl-CoA:carnitine CoA-transferase CaiB-like acyl-CoA transferase
MLAEAGAEVIKVEPLSGDGMRAYAPKWGTDGAVFAMLNAGKKSISIDLKDKAEQQQLQTLVARADIVVEQFRPGVMTRLGLGYEELASANPKLIYCSITGYGQTGPRQAAAGHDLNYAGETGLLGLSMGDVTSAVLPPSPIGDIGGGSYPAMINILLALEQRRRTGRGSHLDIAMSENLFPFSYWALASGFAAGDWPGNGTHLVTGASPRYRIYATRDRQGMVVAALEQKFWAMFCDVIGLDPAFREDSTNPAATIHEIARIIGSEDAAIWKERLAGNDCCCSIIVDLKSATGDPHFAARGVFAHRIINERGENIPALPMPIDAAFRKPATTVVASPALGQDNSLLTTVRTD